MHQVIKKYFILQQGQSDYVQTVLTNEFYDLVYNIINNPEDDGLVVVPDFSGYVDMRSVTNHSHVVYTGSNAYSNIAYADKSGVEERWIAATALRSGELTPFVRFMFANNMEMMDQYLSVVFFVV